LILASEKPPLGTTSPTPDQPHGATSPTPDQPHGATSPTRGNPRGHMSSLHGHSQDATSSPPRQHPQQEGGGTSTNSQQRADPRLGSVAAARANPAIKGAPTTSNPQARAPPGSTSFSTAPHPIASKTTRLKPRFGSPTPDEPPTSAADSISTTRYYLPKGAAGNAVTMAKEEVDTFITHKP
jgi:hypothetical protein